MATRLFVGNLPENTQEQDLHSVFSNFGEIQNLDLKSKSAVDDGSKTFAFVTLSASNSNIESCIRHFSTDDFNGKRLYVTRARESFLERLQRERAEAQQKVHEKGATHKNLHKKHPVIKLGDKLNPRKRKLDNVSNIKQKTTDKKTIQKNAQDEDEIEAKRRFYLDGDKKKNDSEKKRMEALKKKRQEFKERQMILKSGLTNVDNVQNKKLIFSDTEMETIQEDRRAEATTKFSNKNKLFDDNDEASDTEVNFNIKKQFEGIKGQKVLDLQSRYKSDKRFVLDERFIDDDTDGEKDQEKDEIEDQIEVNQTDEKSKQLDILQDVLGVTIKRKIPEEEKERKIKHKIGMLRFDPTQPEHAKFLAPVEDIKQPSTKKSKKKKDKVQEDPQEQESKPEEPRPEVSKEQFYKISDTLKEAITQPISFSLRSLFGEKEKEDVAEEPKEENFIPLDTPKKTKVRNPLEPGEKNPFVYDSSDSETEEPVKEIKEPTSTVTQTKAVWRENLFFGPSDKRLEEGVQFIYSVDETEPQKDRRVLKSLMKKRIYNKERKNQMFQKKIGGRKKTMKKSYKRKT